MQDPVFGNFGEHAIIAYLCMLVAFAVRTAPKPKNVWAMWMMSVIQFGLMNFSEGKSNVDAIQAQRIADK